MLPSFPLAGVLNYGGESVDVSWIRHDSKVPSGVDWSLEDLKPFNTINTTHISYVVLAEMD